MIDLLPPVKAVILAGAQYRRTGRHLTTDCPRCGCQMYIIGRSMVCESPECTFSRGGSIDYLAIDNGYRTALELAADDVPFYRERLAEEERVHRLRRRLIDFGLEAERQNCQPDHERLMLKAAFTRAWGIDPRTFQRGHWWLTTEQVLELNALLLEMGVTPPATVHDRPAAVAPYWGELHQIGALYALGGRMDSFDLCDVVPYRSSWFGLQQMHPTGRQAVAWPTYPAAMACERVMSHLEPQAFPTSLHINAKSTRAGFEFDRLEFRMHKALWSGPIGRWSHTEGFEHATFSSEQHPTLDLRQLLDRLLREAQDNFQSFVDLTVGMKLTPLIRSHLLAMASEMRDSRNAALLQSAISRRLLDIDDQGSIYECADGYQVETQNRARQVTNFILEFTSMTSFSALSDVLYSGRFFVGRAAYDFEIPARRFENPTQLVETLQSIQTLSGADPLLPTATIYRPKDFRRVQAVFRVQNANLLRLRGVASLGWSRKHDQFILPTAVVDSSGIQTGVRYHPDEDGEHHCYDSLAPGPSTVGAMPEFDPYLAEFISALVAQMVRYHHGLKVRLWPLHNTAEGRARAGRIFAGIGQTGPMRLTKIIPRNLELNRGLPCLLAPLANELQLNKLQIAGAVLADRGSDLSKIPDIQIDQAAAVLPALLCEVARRLLANEPVSFRERRSVMPVGTLAEEGARLIREDFWPLWPEVGRRWTTIDRSMEANEQEITPALSVVEASDSVLFRPIFWTRANVLPEDLHLEVGLCCKTVSRGPDGILADRNSVYRLLGEFFGEVPVLLPA